MTQLQYQVGLEVKQYSFRFQTSLSLLVLHQIRFLLEMILILKTQPEFP